MNNHDYESIFEPYEKLVEIEILGKRVEVPENNTLLRCFQFLDMEKISLGDLCWNGECAGCQVWLAGTEREKPMLSCRTKVQAGMKIAKMSKEIELFSDDIK